MGDSGGGEVKRLVTFYSVSSALYAQKILGKTGITCTVIPVPRRVSSSCGYALEVFGLQAAELADEFNKADIEWESIYRQEAADPHKYIPELAFAEN